MVALEPYENMVKRGSNGLTLNPWNEGTSLVHFLHTENFTMIYQNKTRLAWEKTHTPIAWADNCVFGDITFGTPSKVASEIRRLLHYQQMIGKDHLIFINKYLNTSY